jgi:protein SCO1/2
MRGAVDVLDRSLRLSRRAFVAGLSAALLAPSGARAHNAAGVVEPPLAPPAIDVTLDDGRTTGLGKLLAGKVTALQLMFTSCGMTCPIQGAVFASAAKQLGDRVPGAQWLSLTIDPARDDTRKLTAWMARFGAHPRWRAARSSPADTERLVAFLKAQNPGPDSHTAQVYFFDRRGKLALRSVDFPPAAELLRVLEDLAKR